MPTPHIKTKPQERSKSMKNIKAWMASLLIPAFALTACTDDDSALAPDEHTTTYKVAVIMPASEQTRWERTANWALENVDKAQMGLTDKIKLQIVWQDENSPELESFIKDVANDKSYAAIIGPKSSANARKAAQLCNKSQRTLLLPVATSTEFQRIYAGSNYVWNLSQSDITQCELLLSQARLTQKKTVCLIAPNSDYGKSFSDWFAFIATELGLKVGDVTIYKSGDDIRQRIRQLTTETKLYDKNFIFVPGSEEDALTLDDELAKIKEETSNRLILPKFLCSDLMFSSSILPKLHYYTYEGLAPSATPESGFNTIYETTFGEAPINGEAHLYDAVIMLTYALTRLETAGSGTLNDAILATVDGREPWNGSWLPDDMRQALKLLRQGHDLDLSGVTGDWTFDARTHASVLNTTYCDWIYYKGQSTVVDYVSTDGGSRTISTQQAWEWQTKNLPSFNFNQTDLPYPELKDRWAVVVGASDDWVNYRHQADALAMYQLLKRHGYDDDHIILVMEDNLAYNKNNIHPGVVKVTPDGENIYHDVTVDYHLNDISFSDFEQILLGNSSQRLPEVVGSGPNDNVILFWCGHGSSYSLAWGSYSAVSASDLNRVISTMHDNGKYRKMFFALDACYSGSIGEACTGIPGLAVMTAANPYEPSKADMKDKEMGIWLSNGFTRAFQDAIDENNTISLRDLYYICARHTLGSHAMLYNIEKYGNAFHSTMSEYLD